VATSDIASAGVDCTTGGSGVIADGPSGGAVCAATSGSGSAVDVGDLLGIRRSAGAARVVPAAIGSRWVLPE
jgi:hypothetical protein